MKTSIEQRVELSEDWEWDFYERAKRKLGRELAPIPASLEEYHLSLINDALKRSRNKSTH